MMESNKDDEANSGQSMTPMPKHIAFPDIPPDSEILNELFMFLFTTCSAAMQFINIYRTHWWLPQSHVTNTMNLHQIEPFLIALILAMNVRRLVYCLLLRFMEVLLLPEMSNLWRVGKFIIEDLLVMILMTIVMIMGSIHGNLTKFILIYLFIIYLIMFGLKIEPFLRFTCEVKGTYFNGLPLHCCSANVTTIREEIHMLCNDFNNRIKQILFTSIFNAYYAGFLPCFFASYSNYNVLWSLYNICLMWLSILTMGIAFNFPSKYVDILHRSALHLGSWARLDLKPGADCVVSAGASNWNKTTLWASNTIVKYGGYLYRSQGPVTVAFPGNRSHMRFYKLFRNPSKIYGLLTAFQACLIISGIMLLYYTLEWHFVLSLCFVTLSNHFTFFKLMRDYMITKRVYKAENIQCVINGNKCAPNS